MVNWWQTLGNAFWVLDRALGGQRRPARIQKWVARHPIGAALYVAVPFTLFCLLLFSEGEPNNFLFGVLFGVIMGLVFGLTAVAERLRQRRLKRLGIWDGS
ncbi:hypothetical protein ACF08M_33895 [Streptomyces sp. NPDC015032]|uniref:hypothetical protein n=1 Tax=Streptomyces sp. NPDC015032 TaxID=3364937 RepID=UPI0036F4EED2